MSLFFWPASPVSNHVAYINRMTPYFAGSRHVAVNTDTVLQNRSSINHEQNNQISPSLAKDVPNHIPHNLQQPAIPSALGPMDSDPRIS
jgi:hypothetical protein